MIGYEQSEYLDMEPVKFFVRGYAYELVGVLPSNMHLFGVDTPGRIYLFGTDSFGRDVLSRLLYGALTGRVVTEAGQAALDYNTDKYVFLGPRRFEGSRMSPTARNYGYCRLLPA